jgi:phosphatidate cytidylyltransferase
MPPSSSGDSPSPSGDPPGGDQPAASAPAPKHSAPGKHGRAGRDLPAAVGVGLLLLALIVASLAFEKSLFVVLVLAAMVVAIWELRGALATNGTEVPAVPVVVGGAAIVSLAYLVGSSAVTATLAATVLATALWRLTAGAAGFVRDVTAAVFVTVYVPFLMAFVMLLLREDDGALRVVTFILVTIASDIGGYAVGVLFGKHPMAPAISPKKSWEGFAGSAAACALAGWAGVVYLLDGRWWVGVLLGIVAVVTATLGDLVESLIKRDLGIKDMSNLLPGHGGIMDRLDSLLATVPLAWAVMFWLV